MSRNARRGGARRDTLRGGEIVPVVDDDMIIEVSYDVVIDTPAGGEDFEDLTQIREMIQDLRELAG